MLSPLSFSSDRGVHITELPDEYMVRRLDGHWLVAGPTGLFVIGQMGSDTQQSTVDLARTAQQVRESLALRIAWVPFVDTMLISSSSNGAEAGCPIVDPRMIASVILDGHRRLDDDTILEVQRYLAGLGGVSVHTVATRHD